MKKTLLMIFLGLGLITLAACTGNKKVDEQNALPDLRGEIRVENFLDGNYIVRTEDSLLSWHGARIIASDHTGLVDIKSGNLEVADGVLIGGEFTIDLNTISSDQNLESLVTHLKSDDFFDVATYPEAKLIINSVSPGAGSYLIEADLTIKDITAPIVFEANLAQEGEIMLISAEFSIDRTVWNIRYDSGKFFQDLGDKAIKDEITFGVDLMANLQ